MPNISQPPMTPLTPPPADMVLRQCLRRIQIITQSTCRMRLLSGPATLTQKLSPSQYSKIAIPLKNSLKRILLSSKNMSQIRQIWTDQDRHSSTIALDTLWTPLFGTIPVGPQRKTLTLIKIERNTENSSTSQNHSTTELWGRVRVNCATRTWRMSREICVSPDLEVKNWITRNLRRLVEELRTVSPFILITSKNEKEIPSLNS